MTPAAQDDRLATRREFNPFDAIPLFGGLQGIKTRWLVLAVPGLVSLVVTASLLDGTTGSFDSSRLWNDVRLSFGDHNASPAAPRFPLLRDLPSFIILGAIVATLMIVHKQWQLMSSCVDQLEKNGAIVARETPEPSKLLATVSALRPDREERDRDALDTVLRHAREAVAIANQKFGIAFVMLAALIVLGVMYAERNELFAVIAPDHLSAAGRTNWLTATYDSWWASIDHPAGALVYWVVATLGIYLVIMQNVIGMICIYFVFVLPKVAELDADWLNTDGSYGWQPIGRVFRTVRWSLLLHAVTLAVILFAVGLTNLPWVLPLLLIWLVVAPLYVGGSVYVFRRVARSIRAHRLSALKEWMTTASVSAASDPAILAPYSFEVDRAIRARIRPLRLGKWQASVVFGAYVLPMAVPIVQNLGL